MPIVRFEVRAETHAGEGVFIVGTSAALGAWDIELALELETSEKNYPWWTSVDVDIGDVGDIDFRVFAYEHGANVRWESEIQRRLASIEDAEGGVRITNLVFGEPDLITVEQTEWPLRPSSPSVTVTAFLPSDRRSRPPLPAMVVFPGGGYGECVFEHEGRPYAEWLCGEGIAAFVVTYSTRPARHPTQLREGCLAMCWVRRRAKRLGVDSGRIGVIGSSAGAHLAGLVLTANESEAGVDGGLVAEAEALDPAVDTEEWPWLPRLAVLCYPVVTLSHDHACAHDGSRRNLLGDRHRDRQLCQQLSLESRVADWTPPVFLWHTWDDDIVPVLNAYLLGAALAKAGVQHELHVYQHAGVHHGCSLTGGGTSRLPWAFAAIRWLREQGFCDE